MAPAAPRHPLQGDAKGQRRGKSMPDGAPMSHVSGRKKLFFLQKKTLASSRKNYLCSSHKKTIIFVLTSFL
jgi:hypothetical protein